MRSLVSFLSLLLAAPTFANDVYKWVDENGVTHFTTKKPHPEAKPAELPELMRDEYKLNQKFGVTCDKHGGLNCQAGADTDGSVVCMDGFRGASARFAFQCSSPKLVISDVSEVDENGEFKVFLRNSNSVASKDTAVQFHFGEDQKVQLSGPETVEPYGVAEYTFTPSPEVKVSSKPDEAQLSVACSNCS